MAEAINLVRDNRIKETKWSETLNATTNGSFVGNNGQNVNGEILEVNYAFNRTGSIYLIDGQTQEAIFATGAVSGTGTQVKRPRAVVNTNVGAFATGSPYEPYVLNGPLLLGVSGATSGTTALNVTVKYR